MCKIFGVKAHRQLSIRNLSKCILWTYVYYHSIHNYVILSWNLLGIPREYPNTFRSLRVFVVRLTDAKETRPGEASM